MSGAEVVVKKILSLYGFEAKKDSSSNGFRQTELGLLPEDWGISRIDEFFNVSSSKRVFQSDWRATGIPFYRTREIVILAEEGAVDNDLYIDESLYSLYASKYGSPKKGDLLVTGIGTIGKVYLVPNNEKFYFKDASVLWLSPNAPYDSCFLKYLFQSPIVREQMSNSSTGTTVETFTISGAKKTLIIVPPLREQRAIAAALRDVDSLLEELDRLITKKRDLKQAVMQQLLTGQTRLPEFEAEWVSTTIGEVASFYKGKGLPKSAINSHGQNACVHYGELFIKYGSTISETISRTDEFVDACFSVSNDVLMPTSDVTPKGLAKASCITLNDVVLGGDILIIRSNPSVLNGTFLSLVIRMDENQVLRLVTGTTVYHLYGSDMQKFQFSMPEVDEQNAIVEVLSNIDAEIVALEDRRNKTALLKKAMMQELLTGRTRLV